MILYSLAGAAVSFLCMCLAKEKWAFQYDRCQYDRWCHAQYGAASGGYGSAGNSKSWFYYGPVLLAAGVITGLLVGIVTGEVKKRITAALVKKIES